MFIVFLMHCVVNFSDILWSVVAERYCPTREKNSVISNEFEKIY